MSHIVGWNTQHCSKLLIFSAVWSIYLSVVIKVAWAFSAQAIWIASFISAIFSLIQKLIYTLRLLAYAKEKYGDIIGLIHIDVRFKVYFFINAYYEPSEPDEESLSYFEITHEEFIEQRIKSPSPLCRLRFFQLVGWTLAINTYRNEKYEPAIISSGK